jgi:acetone carboxylase gamma subunit
MYGFDDFKDTAEYCNETYGSELIFDEDQGTLDAFICPSCGEPLYFYDWEIEETEFWACCPICKQDFFEGEE